MKSNPILEVREISKRFGGVHALEKVSLEPPVEPDWAMFSSPDTIHVCHEKRTTNDGMDGRVQRGFNRFFVQRDVYCERVQQGIRSNGC
jgi:hypothetical protein